MNITDKEWVSDVNKNFIEKVAPIIFNKACEQRRFVQKVFYNRKKLYVYTKVIAKRII